jgi:hypothetical protein
VKLCLPVAAFNAPARLAICRKIRALVKIKEAHSIESYLRAI